MRWLFVVILLLAMILFVTQRGRSDMMGPSPKILLKTTNTWTAPQVFSSLTILNGNGYGIRNFPDLLISTQGAQNFKYSSPLILESLEVNGNLYVWDLYR